MALLMARCTSLAKTSAFRLVAPTISSVNSTSIRQCTSGEKTYTNIPKKYTDTFPDIVDNEHGLAKKHLLALLQGDDRYEPKVLVRGPGTADQPNIVPSHEESRMIGCICEPDQLHIKYMSINLGEKKRCECGYWYKCVEADPEVF